jgi:TolA-binding protein
MVFRRPSINRVLLALASLLALGAEGFVAEAGAAGSPSALLAPARQVRDHVRELKEQGQWNAARQREVVERAGKIAMEFLSSTDLAATVADRRRRATARQLYDYLSAPLEDIYRTHLSRLDAWSKAVMDEDGDLEALYETPHWREAQLLASQSLYFLNWLHYVGAFLHGGKEKQRLLEEAAKGFSEFAVGEQPTSLRRESLFGRGLCEKELKQYEWAIRDFRLLLQEKGLAPAMERKARLGLLESYVLAEKMTEALTESARFLASAGGGGAPSADEEARARYLRARALFALAKKAKGRKRAQYRQEALALVGELRRRGGLWKKQADALAKGIVREPEEWLAEEEPSPLVEWEQAKELVRQGKYRQAVPLLRKVLSSDDPAASEHKRLAHYFLGVGLFQQKKYRESASHLVAFLRAPGKPKKFGPEAAYLRFKAGEALYARSPSKDNTNLYLDAIRDYLRRYPKHRFAFEAQYRLAEYYHAEEDFLRAAEAYGRVRRDPEFRLRADFGALQCYFSLLDQISEDGNAPERGSPAPPLSEAKLRQHISAGLDRFWKDVARFEKRSLRRKALRLLREYRVRRASCTPSFSRATEKRRPRRTRESPPCWPASRRNIPARRTPSSP